MRPPSLPCSMIVLLLHVACAPGPRPANVALMAPADSDCFELHATVDSEGVFRIDEPDSLWPTSQASAHTYTVRLMRGPLRLKFGPGRTDTVYPVQADGELVEAGWWRASGDSLVAYLGTNNFGTTFRWPRSDGTVVGRGHWWSHDMHLATMELVATALPCAATH